MSKFVLTYYGGGMPETPEAQQASMDAWQAWFGRLGDKVVDAGNPFGASGTVGNGAATGSTGYSIIEASSLDDALTAVRNGHPHVATGGDARVEVYEVLDIM